MTDDDKRKRILTAALEEFSDKGYERASTNQIADRAGVAKGLVFHYFGNKKGLFLAVAEDVINGLIPAFHEAIDDAPGDLLGRISAWTRRKFELMLEQPQRLRFFTAMADAPDPVRAETMAHSERLMRALLPRLLDGVDESRLRPGIGAAEVLEIVSMLSAGLEKSLMPLMRAGKAFDLQQVEAKV